MCGWENERSETEREIVWDQMSHLLWNIIDKKKLFGVVSGCTHGGEMDREMHPSQMALYTGQPLKPLFSQEGKQFCWSIFCLLLSVSENLTGEGGFPVISNDYLWRVYRLYRLIPGMICL